MIADTKQHKKTVQEVKVNDKTSRIEITELNKPNIKEWARLLLQMEQNGTLLK